MQLRRSRLVYSRPSLLRISELGVTVTKPEALQALLSWRSGSQHPQHDHSFRSPLSPLLRLRCHESSSYSRTGPGSNLSGHAWSLEKLGSANGTLQAGYNDIYWELYGSHAGTTGLCFAVSHCYCYCHRHCFLTHTLFQSKLCPLVCSILCIWHSRNSLVLLVLLPYRPKSRRASVHYTRGEDLHHRDSRQSCHL